MSITPVNLVKHTITPTTVNKTPNSAYGVSLYGTAVYRSSQSATLTNLSKHLITPSNLSKH